MADKPEPDQQAIVIDGDAYTLDDLTFREQRTLRDTVRELAGDPEITIGDAPLMDFLPALAFVIKQRTDTDFTLDQALDLRYDQVVAERPTEPAAKPRTRGGSGSRATS